MIIDDVIETEHRLTILEGIAETNKKGIETLHARFSQFDHEQKAELRILGEEQKGAADKILAVLKVKEDGCIVHLRRTEKLEDTTGWQDRWLLLLSSAIASLTGWTIYGGKTIK